MVMAFDIYANTVTYEVVVRNFHNFGVFAICKYQIIKNSSQSAIDVTEVDWERLVENELYS